MHAPRAADPLLGAPYAPPAAPESSNTAAPTPQVVATLRLAGGTVDVLRAPGAARLVIDAADGRLTLAAASAQVAEWIRRVGTLLRLDILLDAGEEIAYRTPALSADGVAVTADRTITPSGSHYELRARSDALTVRLDITDAMLATLVDALRAAGASSEEAA